MFPLIVDKKRTRDKLQVFQEFMLATDMTASGSPEEKLRWAFKMYDKDGSGCGLCPYITVDVGVAVQVDINVGLIADREACWSWCWCFCGSCCWCWCNFPIYDKDGSCCEYRSTLDCVHLSYRFDRAERDDRNHWHPLSDGGCSQGEQTASTKKL